MYLLQIWLRWLNELRRYWRIDDKPQILCPPSSQPGLWLISVRHAMVRLSYWSLQRSSVLRRPGTAVGAPGAAAWCGEINHCTKHDTRHHLPYHRQNRRTAAASGSAAEQRSASLAQRHIKHNHFSWTWSYCRHHAKCQYSIALVEVELKLIMIVYRLKSTELCSSWRSRPNTSFKAYLWLNASQYYVWHIDRLHLTYFSWWTNSSNNKKSKMFIQLRFSTSKFLLEGTYNSYGKYVFINRIDC